MVILCEAFSSFLFFPPFYVAACLQLTCVTFCHRYFCFRVFFFSFLRKSVYLFVFFIFNLLTHFYAYRHTRTRTLTKTQNLNTSFFFFLSVCEVFCSSKSRRGQWHCLSVAVHPKGIGRK
ncbi:hypothetical protein, unlikely [Trypanosoma brucei gambiense DAL972]|uniref:Uncharacterized protein n=1 Tax=Trypanosoma brucei gambiense (strain MHOM/CI/86/DAL972) TaxID=679716 RepID=D0A7B0_TRYB9|nr:hypothetical protein, unlikely [Trypanosoma brucei gambiense DAL972]CBH17561.1 hypothetical protein, unlikely [Trypanosoma brucei gambiense DAL972]|eukprot:XP_011779825.1 hypothetical protein, unlikely [Trypanosoma brucei gambiense DAL972]